jgi:hypothetical protein
MLYALCLCRQKKCFKSSNARLQNVPEIVGSHWIQASRSTESWVCRSTRINSIWRATTITTAA